MLSFTVEQHDTSYNFAQLYRDGFSIFYMSLIGDLLE